MEEEKILEIEIEPPPEKKQKTTDYCSDNSASLPGLLDGTGPIGFEPGMFTHVDDSNKSNKPESQTKVYGNIYIIIHIKFNY